ncbi:MAG: PQQ-binding-like beta-propeller repeat protein [Thermomicrobiales bacterium]
MSWLHAPRREQQTLIDYWDDVVEHYPAQPVPPADAPADLAQVIRTIQSRAAAAQPKSYQDELLQSLLATYEEDSSMTPALPAPALPAYGARPSTSPRPHTDRRPQPPSPHPIRHWGSVALRLALVLLLAFLAASGIWLFTRHDGDHQIATPPVATPTVQTSPDVPMYRGNPARTGAMPGPELTGSPIELWRTDVAGTIDTAPAIVDGVLYFGAGDGGVYALDSATGKTVWTFTGASPIDSSPAIVDGLLYVGSDDGTLYALHTADGSQAWAFPGARQHVSVAVDAGMVFTGSGDGNVYALDATTGAVRWESPLDGDASRSPAVADGMVYVGASDGMLHTFDEQTGKPGWSVQLEGANVATTVVVDGVVYQGTFNGDVNHAYALDAKTGSVLWQFDSPVDPTYGFLPPAVGPDIVYFPSHDQHVYALDRTTGKMAWSFATGASAEASPALIGDTLYFASLDGNLYALDARSGNEEWRFAIEGGADFGPVVVGGVAYVGTPFGHMYAITGSNSLAARDLTTPSTGTGGSPEASPVASPDSIGQEPQITFLWQTKGGPTPFQAPGTVAIAPDGTIWVLDLAAGNFQLFSPDGTYLETWGSAGDGPGEFNFRRSSSDIWDSAGGIAFAPDGSFYVMEAGNRRISQFNADRTFLRSWGAFGSGNGEFLSLFDGEVAPDGNLYVIGDRRNDIQVFAPDGTFRFKFASRGNGPGQLDDTGGLTIDPAGNVYVADFGNNRIVVFAADGTFLRTFGSAGGGDGQFRSPADVSLDGAGRLYVGDLANHRIQVFAPDGTFLLSWSFADDTGTPFTYPGSPALAANGDLIVTDNVGIHAFRMIFPDTSDATPVATPERQERRVPS